MRFNAKKCYIMSINNKLTHFYQLDGHILQQVPENPYLGVTISEDLKWSSHIKITKKANSTLRKPTLPSGDYTSRDHGCVTRMLSDLYLPPLGDRRKENCLIFFFKVVEGLVPALQTHDYLTPVRGKRQIKSRQFKDCVTHNIIDSQATYNSRCFKTVQCKTELFKNSFFPKTIIDWNHLEDCVVRAETVNGFRKAVSPRD